MEFEKLKEQLISNGNQLLSFVTKKDFGMGIIEDVMTNQHIEELNDWFLRAEEFVELYGLDCQKERFDASSWIINQDERVSVERIKTILSLLESIKRD